MNPLYDIVMENLKIDAGQMVEEGHNLESLLSEIEEAKSTSSVDTLLMLQEDFANRPSPTGFPYDEPSDWKSISRSFPDPASHARFTGTDEDLADRILAAWQGRCAGCQLGKPLEGDLWPDKIRETLEFVGSWPLGDYMNPIPEGADPAAFPDTAFFQSPRKNDWTKGRFSAVQPDDDIHYTLTSQMLLEKHGPEFTTEQAMDEIAFYTPYSSVFAAGRNMFKNRIFGFKSPNTATIGNPCRQSLGATIRCDPFGWGVPGSPALAVNMAYKDAVASQTRNGIYAGVFFAVLMADTLAHHDPIRAIDTAASYVPPKSRFAEMITFVKSACAEEKAWERVNTAILERYSEEIKRGFNHSIPNAAIVLLGLLKGEMDFTKTLCITVLAGLDTDCNGATVGSIMGCALGTKGIPDHWTGPFGDTIETHLKGMPRLRITDVARRIYEVTRQSL